jgi:sterol desaturase/sphingolipid hydroxylase (fatty acid hydroxylase superfamily)
MIVALGIESLWRETPANVRINAPLGALSLIFAQVSDPLIAPLVIWVTGRFGPSPLHLSGAGRYLVVSTFLLLAIRDLVDYLFHRAQHSVPWLWALHSFHHSDTDVNASTGYRHYFLDRPLLAFAYLPIGLLFHADASVALLAGFIALLLPLYHHMNVDVNFGRWSQVFVSPQFHRVHHSTDAAHFNKNFCGFLPLWDIIFGTYMEPTEVGETGLGDEPEPTIISGLLWPIRRHPKNRILPPQSHFIERLGRDKISRTGAEYDGY